MSDDATASTRQSSVRDAILRAVRRSKPGRVALPAIQSISTIKGDLTARFRASVEAAGGRLLEVGDGVEPVVAEIYPDAAVVAAVDAAGAGWAIDALADHEMAQVDVLVCRGVLGVAENGAVWLPESRMGKRAAPFLTQHLVLVVSAEEIVPDMHAAYERIQIDAEGFGVFVAGPSKTADIEQSLVVGAHGPRSLTVLLVP